MSISIHSAHSAQSHDSSTTDVMNVHEKEHHGEKALAKVVDLYFLGKFSYVPPYFTSAHSFFHCLQILGLTIVIGGQVFSWNAGLVEGFWEYFACVLFTGSGYLCLILCLSEMASALPFSGGAYGYVRATIGPFFGYLVGCCEAIQNIVYVSVSVIPFAQVCTLAFQVPVDYEPIYWVFFFVTAIYINNRGGKFFWRFSTIIGIVSFLLIIVYILGTIPQMDFEKHSQQRDYPKDGGKFVNNMMQALPVASWFYIGVESIPLACIDCASVSCLAYSHCFSRQFYSETPSC
jgi:amino acid transporter